jgi:hypothetical protein
MIPRIIRENAGKILITLGAVTALTVECPDILQYAKDNVAYEGKRFCLSRNRLPTDSHGKSIPNQRSIAEFHSGLLGGKLVYLEQKLYEAIPGNTVEHMYPGESYTFIDTCQNGMTGSELEKAVTQKIDSIKATYK